MRVLLDENLPRELAGLLPGHEVAHIGVLGLKSISNGELLGLARSEYDCLVTLDKGIQHQHVHAGHEVCVVVIRVPDSRKTTVLAKAPELARVLSMLKPGQVLELA